MSKSSHSINNMDDIDEIVLSVIFILAVLIHMFGFYLLFHTKSTRLSKIQRLYLMNLSICEQLICCLGFIRHTLHILNDKTASVYILLQQWTLCYVAIILAMILLTVH